MYEKMDAALFLQIMRSGARNLNRYAGDVNALNVFPVPDGDTGTDMNLTLISGVNEMEKQGSDSSVGHLAEAFARGLLMGARGNSGVILSQLFRGFSKFLAQKDEIDVRQFAEAFRKGVETAYKAVIKPVEGTILTVAREAATGAGRIPAQASFIMVMEKILEEARRSLANTPNLLPILKKTGVVDAGGQGLVFVYEGMLQALKGEETPQDDGENSPLPEVLQTMPGHAAQADLDPSQIEFGYCTEFLVNLDTTRRQVLEFVEADFRKAIEAFGDSLLVVADEQLVKVHIHAEQPGDVLNFASQYGDLSRIKIDNMREQHANLCNDDKASPEDSQTTKPYGIVAVASGQGVKDLYLNLGVDVVVEGGQSMNPSTQDIATAVEATNAEHVLILPNNKNIILTAQQVAAIANSQITVIPTKSIVQGLTALVGYDSSKSGQENEQNMVDLISKVKSGEITSAIRDAEINGKKISVGDYLGLLDGQIVQVGEDLIDTSRQLLGSMLACEADIVTIIYGDECSDSQAQELVTFVQENYPDVEVEVHYGGQPLYYFLISVE